jgi:hypothetical protein
LHVGKAAPEQHAIDDLGLRKVEMELGEFNRAFHVYARDPYVATAFLDQRMMAWLLEFDPQWDFEIADGWAMCIREHLRARDPYELEPVLDALMAFTERIPPAALSLFGPGSA